MKDQPFIWGEPALKGQPLEEYFPSYHPGMVRGWLQTLPSAGGLVLSPFGSSPQALLEAARAGFRVLAPVHNPVTRLLISGLANPPSRESLNAALARLASGYKGNERLKPHILSLYATECPGCGALTPARALVWSRERGEPVTKSCSCGQCGEVSEGEATADDISRALAFRDHSLTLARALTRVAAPDDPLRVQVEIALRSYPARSVYALQSLLNKISGLESDPREKNLLELLLLQACYLASSPRTRIEAENSQAGTRVDYYQEENVWFALEKGLDAWSATQPPVPIVTWPELPPSRGGLSIFEGRVRDLIPNLKNEQISLVLMVFPRPGLSFWALSALWTGWLWGQEAAAPLRGILSLKSFDWAWMAKAISTSLKELRENLPRACPCLGLLPDLDPSYLLAALSAASGAGLTLEGIALEPDRRVGQTRWLARPIGSIPEIPGEDRKVIRRAAFNLLEKAAEPKPTLSLYGAGLAALCEGDFLGDPDLEPDAGDYLPRLVKDFEENIAYRQGFLHFPEIESWWHQELVPGPSPQADQLEQILVGLLVKSSSPLAESEIFQQLYQALPGLSTPPEGLIKACLTSYAELSSGDNPGWVLKESDRPENRVRDLAEIQDILTELGKELGFSVKMQPPLGNILHLLWSTEVASHYTFFISASGLLSKILLEAGPQPTHPWIILPGSRAELIHYKMDHNPPLARSIQGHYGLIKYRHLRRLAEQGGLTHANIQELLSLDPFTSESPQLPLI